ncbi:hypothetical protein [Pantoea sp. OXWO6B1]|nr:hypothetical protein [Pantoea sp. OXWO6B1]
MDEPPSPASGQPAGGAPVSVNGSRDKDINGPTIQVAMQPVASGCG